MQEVPVRLLIVEQNADLAGIWKGFLEREGLACTHVATAAGAYAALRTAAFDALVLDMELPEGESIPVADFASYRNPDIPIITVSARDFFSDGAIFQLIPNARAMLREPFRPEDMAAMVRHYGARRATDAASGG